MVMRDNYNINAVRGIRYFYLVRDSVFVVTSRLEIMG